jgi:hypothetical protein
MPTELQWLIGSTLDHAEKRDWTWFFLFSNSGRILTESPWRLWKDRIEVTSEDEGQWFGLTEPVNAGQRVILATSNRKVVAYAVAERTSDLTLEFEGSIAIQFLNLSCGYEAWRTEFQSCQVICGSGGTLHLFD